MNSRILSKNFVSKFALLMFLVFILICWCAFAFGENEPKVNMNPVNEALLVSGTGDIIAPALNVQNQEYYFPASDVYDGALIGELLIDLSHNPNWWGDTPANYYAELILIAQGLGFNVTIASDFANIANYDVVIEKTCLTTFSALEIASVETYLDNGGILLLFGEWTSASWNAATNGLLAGLNAGIQVYTTTVYDNTYYYSNTYWPLISDFSDHCLNDNLTTVIYPATSFLTLDNPDSALHFSSNVSYASGGIPPFPLSAIANPITHPNWKLYVAADSSQFLTTNYGFTSMYDNAQWAENILLWCDDCEDDSDCDDGEFCNGAETCNVTTGDCEPGTLPCEDDGLWCNGEETCDETLDQCDAQNVPDCSDDGIWCNGGEYCDEATDQCSSQNPPDCSDDGLWCNGDEFCDEANDQCGHQNGPDCSDDSVFCNGTESCDEASDSCISSGDPCIDDSLFCNGAESCDEDQDTCVSSGDPCIDDGLFCNGAESCDEASDACVSSGDPCIDDGLFCNGTESCDEDQDACVSSGDPCPTGEDCDEDLDECNQRDLPDDDDSVSDDDDDTDGEEELWPEGSVSGGSDSSSCCGC